MYAGAGIVEGTNPSFEWDELDLKASQVPFCSKSWQTVCLVLTERQCIFFQFAKLLRYQEQHIRYQEAENMGTVI